jgi:ribosome-associated protein
MKVSDARSRELVKQCCRALDEKKAGKVRILDVSDISSITNYIIIATATSDPHVRALRVELEKVLDAAKAHIVGIDSSRESGWTVVDAFDVMIHVFAPEMRTRYGLERLWKDAREISLEDILSDKPAAAIKAPAAKKLPAAKKAAKKPSKKLPSKKKKPASAKRKSR